MTPTFQGQTVLITGASSGIGRATALAFAAEGANLVLGNRRSDAGEETAALVRAAGAQVVFVPTDVTATAQVQALVRIAVDTFGRLDVAVNNAGASIEGGGRKLTHQHSDDDWALTLAVNLTAVFTGMRFQIEQMLALGGGAIVNMSSIGGVVASRAGGAAYTAAKHGVLGLTKQAAVEYAGQGIRVNALCPGPILTAMWEPLLAANPAAADRVTARIPLGRLGTVDEVAQAVLWLASDQAAYVTGHALLIDGGINAL